MTDGGVTISSDRQLHLIFFISVICIHQKMERVKGTLCWNSDTANILFDRIEHMLDQRIGPVLDGTNHALLDLFIFEQWRRVPDIHELVLTHDGFRSRIDAALRDYEVRYGPYTRRSEGRADRKSRSARCP
jgi:hypothetical protein